VNQNHARAGGHRRKELTQRCGQGSKRTTCSNSHRISRKGTFLKEGGFRPLGGAAEGGHCGGIGLVGWDLWLPTGAVAHAYHEMARKKRRKGGGGMVWGRDSNFLGWTGILGARPRENGSKAKLKNTQDRWREKGGQNGASLGRPSRGVVEP